MEVVGLGRGGQALLSDLVSHWEPWHLHEPPSCKMSEDMPASGRNPRPCPLSEGRVEGDPTPALGLDSLGSYSRDLWGPSVPEKACREAASSFPFGEGTQISPTFCSSPCAEWGRWERVGSGFGLGP